MITIKMTKADYDLYKRMKATHVNNDINISYRSICKAIWLANHTKVNKAKIAKYFKVAPSTLWRWRTNNKYAEMKPTDKTINLLLK